MFPGGWPGGGLLLLRLIAAIPLLFAGASGLLGMPHGAIFVRYIAIGVGCLLLAGLWTPVAAVLQIVIDLWIAFAPGGASVVHLLPAALGLSLVMLGPGAWSVDARLFGRKRIDIRIR
jgi:putative oxidoreductase